MPLHNASAVGAALSLFLSRRCYSTTPVQLGQLWWCLAFPVMWMPFQYASAVGGFGTFSVMCMLLHNARAVGEALSIFRFFCHVDATPQRQCSRYSIVTFSVMWMLLHYASAVGAALSILHFSCHVDANPLLQQSSAEKSNHNMPTLRHDTMTPWWWIGSRTIYTSMLILSGPCQQAAAYNGSLFQLKTVILGTLRILFGYLEHHFGDPGVRGDTQWTHCGPDVRFYRF